MSGIESGPKRVSFEKDNEAYELVDIGSPEIHTALTEAPVYKKHVLVHVRPAIVGEKITTELANGSIETINTAKENEVVITNPSGEQYILSEEVFLTDYESSGQEGIYNAKGYRRAIKNPFGKPIEIMASWGESQFGDENCMIADICDADGNNLRREPYLIDGDEFTKTYK